jgi:hypothetical protein
MLEWAVVWQLCFALAGDWLSIRIDSYYAGEVYSNMFFIDNSQKLKYRNPL